MNSKSVVTSALVGEPVLRSEDERLLRGLGAYVDDLPEPPGTVQAVFVLSPYAHARIASIDTTRAVGVAGVIGVLTGRDFGSIKPIEADARLPGYQPVPRPVIAKDCVKFVGEVVAVILAVDRYVGEDAAELVDIDYEPLPAIVDIDGASAPDAMQIHSTTRSNILFESKFSTDGFDQAFASSHLVVRETFRSNRLAAVSIEPRGCLASYDQGRQALTLWSSTQIPHLLRTALGDLLGIDESNVRVVAPDVGGGFGVKATIYPEEILVAELARRYGRPVKWICDRREDLISSTHARDFRFDVAMGFDKDARLTAVKADIIGNIGAYPSLPFGSSAEASGAAIFLPGSYRLKHYAYRTRAVTTNTCPTGVYRGVVAPVAFFATEALMDRAAHEFSLDPAEIRLKNVIRPEDLPYINAVGIKLDASTYESCLTRALDEIGYFDFRSKQPRDRYTDGKHHGIGIACVTEHTGQGASRYRKRGLTRIPGYDSALVKVEPNGRAVAWVSQATQGQGHMTAYAQIVAEELGLRFEDVTVMEGDTAQGPYGTGTFASRGVVTGGGAVLRASRQVAAKMRRIAAHLLEAAEVDIELVAGEARIRGVPNLKVTAKEVAAVAYSLESRELPEGENYGLEATDYYDPPVVSITNATHIAHVSVDSLTGLVRVERYVVVHDCGRVINPTLVAGQLHGGIVQGLGSVLSEAVLYDSEGQLLTTTLMDYLLPTIGDVPDITVNHQESPSKDTEGGFKGVGEGGVIGAVPAIANAVRDALQRFQVKANVLPLRPDSLLMSMQGRERLSR